MRLQSVELCVPDVNATAKFFEPRSANCGLVTEFEAAVKPTWSATFPWVPFQRQLPEARFPVPTGLPAGHQDSTL